MKFKRLILTSVLATIGFLGSAHANQVLYDFSQGGWQGGGEITGSFVINEDYNSGSPGLETQNALISFHAHWSGNPYSQPYDWDLSDLFYSNIFVWAIGDHRLADMTVGPFLSGPGPWWDPFVGVIWDNRPSFIQFTGENNRFRTAGKLEGHVPDAASTGILLGIGFAGLAFFRWNQRNFYQRFRDLAVQQ